MSCKMLFFDYRDSEEDFFKKNDFSNFDIKFFKESLNEETFNKLSEDDIENTMIISVFISSTIDENIISRFKNLRVISTRSTGYDHIDVNSCVNKNIALINVDSYGDSAVAQFAFMLILMLVRKIDIIINSKTPADYEGADFTGRNLNTLTLGVIGTGIIGSSICRAASCFGMKILAYDMRQNQDLIASCCVEYVDLHTLLKNSDVVTLHAPYTKDNYQMIGYEQLKIMKQDSYFVNVSRGELVDTNALLEFAKEGKFKGIGLDVVACQDINCPENELEKTSVMCLETSQAVKELAQLPNVILTPHIAYDTQEAVDFILETTFKGLSDFLTGGKNYRVV